MTKWTVGALKQLLNTVPDDYNVCIEGDVDRTEVVLVYTDDGDLCLSTQRF